MTDDLISRRDAIDELTKFFCDNDVIRGDFPNCERNERKAMVLMENVRSIDAVPVRHAKWVYEGKLIYSDYNAHNTWSCSGCSCSEFTPTRFCPNCGARMDEE